MRLIQQYRKHGALLSLSTHECTFTATEVDRLGKTRQIVRTVLDGEQVGWYLST